jgi:hypothetical protein
MDVTADGDRRPDFDNVGLVFKYLLGDVAKFLDEFTQSSGRNCRTDQEKVKGARNSHPKTLRRRQGDT